MPQRQTISTKPKTGKSQRLLKNEKRKPTASQKTAAPKAAAKKPSVGASDSAVLAQDEAALRGKGSQTNTKTNTKRDERRAEILDVATRLFAERGYANCDMSTISSDLGIAKGTVYLYFKSKEELFLSSVESGIDSMQAAIQSVSRKAQGLDYIAQVVEAYLEFFDRHPQLVELFIQERAVFNRPVRPRYFEFRDANRSKWRDVYLALIQAGLLRNDIPVETMLDTVGALLYGTIFTNYLAGRRTSREEQTQGILAILFHGIARSGK